MNVFRKLGFFSAFLLPVLVVAGYYGGGYWNLLSIGFVFVFVPLVDQLVGIDTINVATEKKATVSEELYYRFVTYAWTFVQMGFFAWVCVVFAGRGLTSPFEWVAFTIGFGLVTGGIGITVAHELGHKKSAHEQWFSQALLMTVCYMHFFIEHNRGHHVNVATPLDPATARKGQDAYRFWWQSTLGSWLHAWTLEKESLERRGRPFWSLDNRMLMYTLLPILFGVLLTWLSSELAGHIVWEMPLFFAAQSLVAFTLLELVNYIEHYGMTRRLVAPGQYERVNPLHSWNTSYLISNFFLFQLQRHSDHHYHAAKRYQVLDHYEESPQLPFGYPTMILIALVPPLWFRTIDPLLESWQKQTALTPST
ncbi:MAG: alkane 1-monooxygenase [Cyclobacteriaceae bacterium]|nr:alkane 1-monooxygenase [Cyclobacteriaceae bacterium]